jgi:hypothetical protein
MSFWRSPSHSFQASAKVFEQTEKMIRIAGQSREAKMLVERPGLFVLGVNCKCPNAGDLGRLHCSLHRVFEEAAAKAPSLPGCCDGKPRQKHDGDRMTSKAFREPFVRTRIFNLADDKRIVTGDRLVCQRDVSLGGFGLLVLKCVAREKAVQGLTAALELIDPVTALKLFNLQSSH